MRRGGRRDVRGCYFLADKNCSGNVAKIFHSTDYRRKSSVSETKGTGPLWCGTRNGCLRSIRHVVACIAGSIIGSKAKFWRQSWAAPSCEENVGRCMGWNLVFLLASSELIKMIPQPKLCIRSNNTTSYSGYPGEGKRVNLTLLSPRANFSRVPHPDIAACITQAPATQSSCWLSVRCWWSHGLLKSISNRMIGYSPSRSVSPQLWRCGWSIADSSCNL